MFGVNEPQLLRIMTTTLREGDPSFAGALAGIGLGLECFHILELKAEVPEEVWQQHMALEELQIDDASREQIMAAMSEGRGG